MLGDLVFYIAGPALHERLAAHFTNDPYCHVAVDMGDGTAIGAYRAGIRLKNGTTITARGANSPR